MSDEVRDSQSQAPLDTANFLLTEEHVEDDGETIWLLSYADLMTLLFTLFVMLYASIAKYADADEIQKLLAYHFGTKYEQGIKNLNQLIIEAGKDDPALAGMVTETSYEGIKVIFTSSTLFDSSSAKLTKDARESFNKIAKLLHEKAADYKIKVEGHTDDRPIVSTNAWPSNWELSSARATTLVRLFEDTGFKPDQLTAIGYGYSRPAAPNRSPAGEPIPENMAKNRRVVLTVSSP